MKPLLQPLTRLGWVYDVEEGFLDPDEVAALRVIERVSTEEPGCGVYPARCTRIHGCPCWLWIVLRRLQARDLIAGSRRHGWRLTARGERLLKAQQQEEGDTQ